MNVRNSLLYFAHAFLGTPNTGQESTWPTPLQPLLSMHAPMDTPSLCIIHGAQTLVPVQYWLSLHKVHYAHFITVFRFACSFYKP